MLKAATNLELLSAEEKAEAIESDFLLGTQEKSAREWFPVFQAGGAAGSPDLYAMKWRNYKVHLIWQERQYDAPQRLPVPRLIDLYDNPQERPEETMGESAIVTRAWVLHAMFAYLNQFQASLKTYPPIRARRAGQLRAADNAVMAGDGRDLTRESIKKRTGSSGRALAPVPTDVEASCAVGIKRV